MVNPPASQSPQSASEKRPDSPSVAGELASLRGQVHHLQMTVQEMEAERIRQAKTRRRRLAFIGGSFSLLFHIALLIYLSMLYIEGRGETGAGEIITFAALDEEDLSDQQQTEFDELTTEEAVADPTLNEVAELSATAPEVTMQATSSGAVQALGASGSGSGEGMGLGGGGGGTSFFGISSKGVRFAYIVDISGSMGESNKMNAAKRELARSIDSLPDFSSFFVLLFSYDAVEPPMQKGWTKARKPLVQQFIRWLSEVGPGGGTQPRSAFMRLFALETRPDVLFFLTDGQFNDISAEEIAMMNGRGKKIVINTIAFGDTSGEAVLRAIAKQSGGVYRFVPAGGP